MFLSKLVIGLFPAKGGKRYARGAIVESGVRAEGRRKAVEVLLENLIVEVKNV
jgi:hypothetical protein